MACAALRNQKQKERDRARDIVDLRARLPRAVLQLLQAQADQLGMNRSNYAARVLAAITTHPDPRSIVDSAPAELIAPIDQPNRTTRRASRRQNPTLKPHGDRVAQQ